MSSVNIFLFEGLVDKMTFLIKGQFSRVMKAMESGSSSKQDTFFYLCGNKEGENCAKAAKVCLRKVLTK